MPRLTVRNLLMPAATLVVVSMTLGLILFGTRGLPFIVVALAAILGGLALLVAYTRRRSEQAPENGRRDP